MSYKPHTKCRACNLGADQIPTLKESCAAGPSEQPNQLVSVLNLGFMPLPNAFKKAGEARPGHYPVELMVCPKCTLGQLSAVVDPAVMYADYPYVTSNSHTMREHFGRLWECLNHYRKIETVVEIGSNDGLMLEYFKQNGATAVIGIDPAENLCKIARERKGVSAICSLFNRNSADMALSSLPPIDLVIARHVFCHIDDWQDFVNNLTVLCAKDTVICIEIPYAQDMIERVEWDTVYAEHTSYLTLQSIKYLLHGSALKLQAALKFPVHGGAIGLIIRRQDCAFEPDGQLIEAMEGERCSLEEWKKFGEGAKSQIESLKYTVVNLRASGKTVAGYGASAKSSQWVNACNFTRKHISFITDDTPQKQWSTAPGTNIPILDPGALLRELPDYVILWSWNYRDEILEKESLARSKGVKFIIPRYPIEIV